MSLPDLITQRLVFVKHFHTFGTICAYTTCSCWMTVCTSERKLGTHGRRSMDLHFRFDCSAALNRFAILSSATISAAPFDCSTLRQIKSIASKFGSTTPRHEGCARKSRTARSRNAQSSAISIALRSLKTAPPSLKGSAARKVAGREMPARAFPPTTIGCTARWWRPHAD